MVSNYAFAKASFSMTPQRLSLFMPGMEAKRNIQLLKIKQQHVYAKTGLYSIQTSKWHGFQTGDPSQNGGSSMLFLFDDHDHEVRLIFATDKQAKTKVTQADVNRVVQTLLPVMQRN